MFKLKSGDEIICAFAAPAAGPGWANQPIRLVIVNYTTGAYRQEYIQPNDQTIEMRALYGVSAAAHGAMLAEVNRSVSRGTANSGAKDTK